MKLTTILLISLVIVLGCRQTGQKSESASESISNQTEQVVDKSQEPMEDSDATKKQLEQTATKSKDTNEVLEKINARVIVTLISANKYNEGTYPAHSYGDLYPEDANYTRDEVLAAENKLLKKIALAKRQDNKLVIGSLKFQSEQANTYWFQGVTAHGFMMILNQTVRNGIRFSKMILVNSDGSSSIELSNTRIIYELDDGRLIQVYSEPIPGKPNGVIKILEVNDDQELIEITVVKFDNKRPTDIKEMGKDQILVMLAVDDSGESPPEFVKIKI